MFVLYYTMGFFAIHTLSMILTAVVEKNKYALAATIINYALMLPIYGAGLGWW